MECLECFSKSLWPCFGEFFLKKADLNSDSLKLSKIRREFKEWTCKFQEIIKSIQRNCCKSESVESL